MAALGPFDESQRPEEGPVVAQLQPHVDPQPATAHLARGRLRRRHQGTANGDSSLHRLDREASGIGAIVLPPDRHAAQNPAGALGEQDGTGLHGGPDGVRCFQQRTRLRSEFAAIFPERPLDQRDDRLGFVRTRRPNQEGVALHRLFPHLGVLPIEGAILSSSELADQRRKRLLGLGITFLAALFISLVTTFARIAYESGSNPATQVFLRSLCMMLAMGGLQLALGRSLMLPRRTILTTIVFGLCILVMSFGYLSSVFYISISLAVLLLYTYPLMVGIASPLLGRERMTWMKALCLIGAFAGLVVASWDGFGALDWRGIAFALAAAGSISVIALFGGAAMSRAHPFVMNAWMNVWVVLAVGLYLMAAGSAQFPQSAAGWLATFAVCICYTLGILFLFMGLMLISPAQSALTMNLEPLFSTIAAILLLHEAVALRQWFGLAMLLIFLAISTLAGMTRREKS